MAQWIEQCDSVKDLKSCFFPLDYLSVANHMGSYKQRLDQLGQRDVTQEDGERGEHCCC